MSSVTRFLLDRASEPRLEAPAPPRDVLEQAFQCAARAPDHALLRPWRYLVIEGEALEALGELFASACPETVEQVMSAATGMAFIGLALRDAGYGGMWRTGPVTYHAQVHRGLGLAQGESIVGFLYTGTVVQEKPPVPRPETREFVENWQAPGQLASWDE